MESGYLYVVNTARGTGRTQKMLALIADQVANGQPLFRVIGAHNQHVRFHLFHRVFEVLDSRGFSPVRISQREIRADSSVITFHTADDIERFMRGRERHNCEFWDHYALEWIGHRGRE